jgi:hypothetical protein
MEQNLAHLTRGDVDARNRIEVLRFPILLTPPLKRRRFHLPDADFTVFSSGSNDRVDMRGPVCVKDGGGMTTSERYYIWKLVRKAGYRARR